MDDQAISNLVSTVDLISTTLDSAPHSWRDQLQAIRNITASLEILDATPDENRKRWQLPLITVFQRVAFADADNGGVPDIANWCLRQALTLLQIYPMDVDLLALIGRNWLLRAQKSLARIHYAERGSSSSGASSSQPLSNSEEQRQFSRAVVEAEDRLHSQDYVEARGILLPAVEYLKRAVDAAREQHRANGTLYATAAEAYMSLGNVSSVRINEQYFHEALGYLRAAAEIQDYTLPNHLQQ
ncbi:hypothetical protein EJ04DRAFT_427519 [Polyplosphaeria fusca]|uniref:Uncharacterized protein n=1 Tax=Polyplosphaeria fusca TaxID=682080 RepID=A0A9P4R9Y1_9PLEO|nr:hypothetical protein EJ04DRAFT_427519 [Polyplosphaeria fusca]